jgi:hypothetical protein
MVLFDQMHAARKQQTALETNPAEQSSSWTNPDTGNSGTGTPTKILPALTMVNLAASINTLPPSMKKLNRPVAKLTDAGKS